MPLLNHRPKDTDPHLLYQDFTKVFESDDNNSDANSDRDPPYLLTVVASNIPGSKIVEGVRSWAYQKTGINAISIPLYDESLTENSWAKTNLPKTKRPDGPLFEHWYNSGTIRYRTSRPRSSAPSRSSSSARISTTEKRYTSLASAPHTNISGQSQQAEDQSSIQSMSTSTADSSRAWFLAKLGYVQASERIEDVIQMEPVEHYQETPSLIKSYPIPSRTSRSGRPPKAPTVAQAPYIINEPCQNGNQPTHKQKLFAETLMWFSVAMANTTNWIGDRIDDFAISLDTVIVRPWANPVFWPLHKPKKWVQRNVIYVMDTATYFASFIPGSSLFSRLFKRQPEIRGVTFEDMCQYDYVPGPPRNQRLAFSFGGTSICPMYELGVAQCFQEHLRPSVLENSAFTGYSTGVLVATGLALDLKLTDIYLYLRRMAAWVPFYRTFGLFSVTSHFMEHILNEWLPDEVNIPKGRLQVPIRHVASGNTEIRTEFYSKAELKQVLMAAIFQPILHEKPVKLENGDYYMATGELPTPLPYTITVSYEPRSASISPPEPEEPLSWAQVFGFNNDLGAEYTEGYQDARVYLYRLHESGELSSLFFQRVPTRQEAINPIYGIAEDD